METPTQQPDAQTQSQASATSPTAEPEQAISIGEFARHALIAEAA